MSERIDRLEAIFHAAAELSSAAQRANYLNAACEGDPNLRREVEALLKAIPVGEDMFQDYEQGRFKPSLADAELIGSSVGPYKLLEIIGEGGMGVVYMAEQEKPVRRKVAMKIIKLGMDTKQVVARFEAERQALAIMDNPNIAQVLDGGATDTGRPYFVMELVQGVPITEFCGTNHLSIEERLKLFIVVCQAIQSAHQKGIIHRDIKPTNVLVTIHNGAPHPMVIDFGVAKATGQKLTEKTLFTNFATMIGTPAYMSPEQAEMSKLDVDTRSDIYSLGVLLYELLTGTTPFPEGRLRSVAYAEMQRIIAEEEPERPSTRLRKKAVPKSKIQNPKSQVDSDLDWIVMKCLEKDRNRRYETANALAEDTQAHLDDEPVFARPPSAAYRFRKFVRRNRARVAAGSFALIVLVVAILLSTWQAVRATRAERSSRAVKDFLVEQVLAANPYVDSQGDPNRRVQLERLGRALEGKFTDEPLTEAELRMVLGGAIAAAGDKPAGLSHFQRAFEIRQRELGLWHSDTLWSLSWVGQAEGRTNGKTTVRDLLEQCSKKIRSSRRAWSSGEAEVVWTYADFVLWREEHRAADALVYLREALQECRRNSDTNDYRFQNKLAEFARVVEDAGHFEEAEALWKENIAHAEQVFGAEHLLTIQFKKGYAYFLVNRDRLTESAHILANVVPIYQRVLSLNHGDVLDAEGVLAQVYQREGRLQEAALVWKSLYPRWAKYLPSASAREHCEVIAAFFVEQQSYQDAQAVHEALRESWESNPPENSHEFMRYVEATAKAKGWAAAAELCRRNLPAFPDSVWVWMNQAWVFRYVGDEENYQRVVAMALAVPASIVATNDQHFAIEIAALGAFPFSAEQVKQLDQMMNSLEVALPSRPTDVQIYGYRAIGLMQLRLGRFDRGIAALDQAASRQNNPEAYPLFIRAMCAHRLGRFQEARAAFDQAEVIMKPLLSAMSGEADRFLPTWQIYQQLLMHRETKALLGIR